MKKFLYLLLPVLVFLILYNPAEAASKKRRIVRLDEQTLQKGYTISNKDFSVGIQPDTFSDSAKVYLRPVKQKKVELPDNLNLVSDIYLYSVEVPKQKLLKKVIWLSLDYDSDSKYKRDLYFLNGETDKWQKLLSSDDRNNKRIKSGWWFPYSIVAVFEDPNQLAGPEKASYYNDFGALDSAAAIVIDEKSGKVLYEKNANQQRSIASLTKVMTALVFLETGTSMDNVVSYNAANNTIGAKLHIDHGETLTVKDVFYTMLVGSANNCALTLADSTGLSRSEFIGRMNQKAKDLDLANTHFADPSGLDPNNVSTASDYAKLIQVALDEFEILQASTTKYYNFSTMNAGRYHSIKNTNAVLDWSLYLTGGKTGYLDEALYTLMLKAKQGDDEVITVVLGNYSSYDRFVEAYDLTKWAFSNYSW